MICTVSAKHRQGEVAEVVEVDAGLAGGVQTDEVQRWAVEVELLLRPDGEELVGHEGEPEDRHGDAEVGQAGEDVVASTEYCVPPRTRPTLMAMISEIRIPQKISCIVKPSARVVISKTWSPVLELTPQSPRTKCVIQVHHWATIGRSRPSSLRFSAMSRAASRGRAELRRRVEGDAHAPEDDERRDQQDRDRVEDAAGRCRSARQLVNLPSACSVGAGDGAPHLAGPHRRTTSPASAASARERPGVRCSTTAP